ncbi:glycosyltransferase [Methylomonas sp. SURF-2]|uniref:Glycosyltransferase n=1 Tax=Methylomonas subterranea TaxID=2952225 RepID=A0ABT1TKC2_9GAMM|nr:glycosyltransferase [Methylomonas sp. SURF-2]MCQ8105929.1 glycosyltransferase [Methylomonas sp. SURF-2]
MKIFQTIAGIDKISGGPSYTIPSLCSNLHRLGANIELHLLSCKDSNVHEYDFDITLHRRGFPGRLGTSNDMKISLLNNVKKGDIIHAHGLWLMPNIYPYNIAKSNEAKFILSPRGMLSKWSLNRSRVAKIFMGKLGQYSAILNSHCIHVTAESEYDDVRAFGYKGPICIIPNGIDLPDKPAVINKEKTIKKLIFISRVHPKKGIELLLDAWTKIYQAHPDWELDICGPGDSDYISKIIKIIDTIPNSRVRYVGPLYGGDKHEFYNNANLFVLPTHSENFGVVVAEALSNAIPVIVSKGAPWEGVIDNNCGWWINNTVDELVNTLSHALTLPPQVLYDMGMKGRLWMENDFSWITISKNMLSTYQWLNNMIDKPDFVLTE